jgi:hypothetical protein
MNIIALSGYYGRLILSNHRAKFCVPIQRAGWMLGRQARSDTRSWSPILCMSDDPGTKAEQSRIVRP